MFGQTGFIGTLIVFGALQGFVLAILFLVRRRGDEVANRLLGALILIISINLAELAVYCTGLFMRIPHATGFAWPFLLLVGPIYWLYIRHLLGLRFRFRWVLLLHALPFLIFFAQSIPWLFAPSEAKIAFARYWLENAQIKISWTTIVFITGSLSQQVIYLALSTRLLRSREENIRRRLADNEVLADLRSLKRLTAGFAVYLGAHLLFVIALLIWSGYGILIDKIWFLVLSLFVQAGALAAIHWPETFSHSLMDVAIEKAPAESTADEANSDSEVGGEAAKYRRSALPAQAAERFAVKLREHLAAERPYLNRTLKLGDVSEPLGLSSHHLSQVINRELGVSFFDLINEYRIEEAKRLLADPSRKHITILGIAYDSGFNNKTSFNQAFKKFAGVTPSAYRKSLI